MSLAELETGSVRKFRRRKGDFAPWDSLEPADKDRYLLGLGIAGSSKAERLIHPTKAGLLMFGRLEAIRRVWPCYEVKYKRYRGIGTVEVLEEEFGECNLFEFWCGVAYKLTLDLKVPFGLSEQYGPSGMQRLGVTPVHYAIWEAFERCLVNADFGRGGVVVTQNNEKIVFESWPRGEEVKQAESNCLLELFRLLRASEPESKRVEAFESFRLKESSKQESKCVEAFESFRLEESSEPESKCVEAFERCGLKIKMPKFEESREQDKLTVTVWM